MSQVSGAGRAVFSASRIAEILASSPSEVLYPTEEQSLVIEQPLGGSVLVIAGAGSGKTETMANRVVWLVANGLVQPDQILGLTFTRKAAGELGERVTHRLQRFAERLEDPSVQPTLSASERAQAVAVAELMHEGLNLPEVSTYNAFASAVVQEFGALAGVAAGATVIDQATAWGIARDVVRASDDPELVLSRDSISVIVKQVLQLDHAVSDNLTDFDEVVRCVEKLHFLETLPYNAKKAEGRYAVIDDVLENMKVTRLAVRLARDFAAEKRRRGLIEFSDQLALAVQTLRRSQHAILELRHRTPVVLLDEVQDTSVGQTVLLSTLFAGASVMAVGDPHQSIYGFRGASSSNLLTFHRDFAAPGVKREQTLSLSTSWRNPSVVLEAANVISEPLTGLLKQRANALTVKRLTSRSELLGTAEDPGVKQLEARVFETIDEEFSEVASWMRDARNEHLAQKGKPPTAAVVFRARRHMAAASAALWREGVPNRIVGLGGLLTTPEVIDLVSLLRCIWHADASNELLRLLAGPRFRLGVADLAGLRDAARWFSQRDHAKQLLSQEDLAATSEISDPERRFTLLDALDEISVMPDLDHTALRGISEVGKSRLREAGKMLHTLRQQLGTDIHALIRSAVQHLRLDIELEASEYTGYEGSAAARANLDAFAGTVEAFLATDETGTLASVLDWLERATEDDEPAEHVPEPEPGTVQLITVHGAKGLEWDLVAIPRMVEAEFPASSREGMGWLRAGQLPDELRGDAAARPKLNIEAADTQQDVKNSIASFQEELKTRHAEEERRLAYVAVTRTGSRLLLTGSFWGGQAAARGPAVFLKELEAAGIIDRLPTESQHDSDPNARSGRTLSWPLDPLGRRSSAVHAAADVVRNALADKHHSGDEVSLDELLDEQTTHLHPVVRLLLVERAAEGAERAGHAEYTGRGAEARPAERLTASTFHEFVENPIEAERRRLRPMPLRPYRQTRTGNLFHEWVERRTSTPLGTSLTLDGFESEPHEELQVLIERFEQSRWADLQPLAVELEIALPFAGRTMVCKLDAVYEHKNTTEKGDESSNKSSNKNSTESSHKNSTEHSTETRYEIVDWKSGRPPANEAERQSRFLQLDLYRHAYASWAGVDPTNIDVTLFYVAEGEELRGENMRSLEQLEQLWLDAADLALP